MFIEAALFLAHHRGSFADVGLAVKDIQSPLRLAIEMTAVEVAIVLCAVTIGGADDRLVDLGCFAIDKMGCQYILAGLVVLARQLPLTGWH